jgi:hypothetical protein
VRGAATTSRGCARTRGKKRPPQSGGEGIARGVTSTACVVCEGRSPPQAAPGRASHRRGPVATRMTLPTSASSPSPRLAPVLRSRYDARHMPPRQPTLLSTTWPLPARSWPARL